MDKAVVSCKGLDLKKGVTDSSEDNAEIKKSMISCAKKLILAADSTKFGKISFAKIVDFRKGDVLVTDALPDNAWRQRLEEIGVTVVTEVS